MSLLIINRKRVPTVLKDIVQEFNDNLISKFSCFPSLYLESAPDLKGMVNGMYYFTKQSAKIKVRRTYLEENNQIHLKNNIVHEYGHHIDYHLSLNYHLKTYNIEPKNEEKWISNCLFEIDLTKIIRDLLVYLKSTDGIINIKQNYDIKNMNYWLSNCEIFARAFSQWYLTKYNLLTCPPEELSTPQWKTDEFKPAMQMLDTFVERISNR